MQMSLHKLPRILSSIQCRSSSSSSHRLFSTTHPSFSLPLEKSPEDHDLHTHSTHRQQYTSNQPFSSRQNGPKPTNTPQRRPNASGNNNNPMPRRQHEGPKTNVNNSRPPFPKQQNFTKPSSPRPLQHQPPFQKPKPKPNNYNQPQRQPQQQPLLQKKKRKNVKKIKELVVPDVVSAIDLSRMVGIEFDRLARKMKEVGIDAPTHEYILSSDLTSLILLELHINPITNSEETGPDVSARPEPTDWSTYPPRPPVVTIMGHVDHGKTTLLDSLRKTSVAASEAGGITQHIGAFEVILPSGKKLTFLDTPGHEAFSAMRARGAQTTDIVVLVVAADDGVMPQTIEAIRHAKEADVPVVVAINKCDKPGVDVRRIKESLLQHEVILEEYGGEIPSVEVSGLTGLGLDELEETLLTVSEVLDIRGDPEGHMEGVILESKLDRGRGNVATVLVTRGTLKPGDVLVAGRAWCKTRHMVSASAAVVQSASPSTPIEITGWKELPKAGDKVLQVETEDFAKRVMETRQRKYERLVRVQGVDDLNDRLVREKLELNQNEEGATKILPLIVKADVHGSLEAIMDAVNAVGTEEVRPRVIFSGVGPVTESDLSMAETYKGLIFAFNVRPDKKIVRAAEKSQTKLLFHKVIYKLLDDLKESLSDMLPPETVVETVGEADLAQVFDFTMKGGKTEKIAGCKVQSGKMVRGSAVKILRKNKIVWEGNVRSLKHFKKDVNEINKGNDCGIIFEGFEEFEAGDLVRCVLERKVKRKL